MLHIVPAPLKSQLLNGICHHKAIRVKQTSEFGMEGYHLCIQESEILIEGEKAGVFYAQKTLEQLMHQYSENLPCMEITDRPRFEYRGFMIDSSRHFLPIEDIKTLIDAAASLKLNKMHWHLVDDQAFRLEIKAFPQLAIVGCRRGKMHFGNIEEPEESCDYFTQEQVKEIIAYAADRMIEIIPEIEIPGHESALLAACPEAGCQSHAASIQVRGGIFDELICAGKEESFQILQTILQEVAALFPGQYIHIGGDEAVKKRWRECPDCQRKKKELGLQDENMLQQWLLIRAKDVLTALGKKVIVWNDSLRGGVLPSDFIVQAWMGDRKLVLDFLNRGGRLIWSDTEHYYMDYPYNKTDVKKILSESAIPEFLRDQKGMMGVECPLWTERVASMDRACHLLFPRIAAVAENGWTEGDARDNAGFVERYEELYQILEKTGIHHAPQEYWNIDEKTAEKEQAYEKWLFSTPENLEAEKLDQKLIEEELGGMQD